jgi:hypothetical protein
VGGVLTFEELGAFEALGKVKIIGVGNNQTGNPMVSPKRLSVEMHGGPMFPKEGKEKFSLGKGVPSLVLLGIDVNCSVNSHVRLSGAEEIYQRKLYPTTSKLGSSPTSFREGSLCKI